MNQIIENLLLTFTGCIMGFLGTRYYDWAKSNIFKHKKKR